MTILFEQNSYICNVIELEKDILKKIENMKHDIIDTFTLISCKTK